MTKEIIFQQFVLPLEDEMRNNDMDNIIIKLKAYRGNQMPTHYSWSSIYKRVKMGGRILDIHVFKTGFLLMDILLSALRTCFNESQGESKNCC